MKSRALSLAALALLVSLSGWNGTAVRPAAAQALDANKPPSQIFSGTCSACHRSPRGLVRSMSPRALPGFLRQHYTTGSEMANEMSAYVLASGGADRVAEPAPKREPRPEPKQRAKSDAPEVAARNPDQNDLSKSAKQRAAKKGRSEPAEEAKETPADETAKGDPAKNEPAKDAPAKGEPETADTVTPEPAAAPAKPEAAAVECKVEEPAKQTAAAAADENKAEADAEGSQLPTPVLTLPGFPPPPSPEGEPVAAAAATQPGCDPAANGPTTAAGAEKQAEQVREEAKEQADEQPPPAMAEGPKTESSPDGTTEAAPSLDIMQEEVHGARPARTGQQKKRAP